MNVIIIGSGYVGLVAAVGFAEAGHQVLGVDVDRAKVDGLKQGKCPIYEPGLQELLAKHLACRTLTFGTEIAEGIRMADAVFICVGTPQSEDGSADLRSVIAVAGQLGIAMGLRSHDAAPLIVADKSTVPVGTALRVHAAIAIMTDRPFEVVSNPEFLREGCALSDFFFPDRVVVGCRSEHAARTLESLYRFHLDAAAQKDPGAGKFLRMDPASAEMTKYAANAMLASRISFINEMAALCEAVGANVDHVRVGIGSDQRIGKHFLQPGPGFGGSCFPKDLQALLKVGREHRLPLRCLEATVEANRHQKQVLAHKIRCHYDYRPDIPACLANKTFTMWGLAFKAHTDDIRESMALELIESLTAQGAELVVHDFEAMPNVRAKIGDRVRFAQDPLEACEGADALIIATEWPQYSKVDLAKVAKRLKTRTIFDGRNLFDPDTMRSNGWTYVSIGRSVVRPTENVDPSAVLAAASSPV
jgi:UDPglucose 6-dehydrogenase